MKLVSPGLGAASEGSQPPYASTVASAFLETVFRYPGREAVRTLDGKLSLTWGQVYKRVSRLAGGLHRQGVRRGEVVALMMTSRPERLIADVAVMSVGAIPLWLGNDLATDQIIELLRSCAVRTLLSEQDFLEQVIQARECLPDLTKIVILEGEKSPGTLDWQLVEAGLGLFEINAAISVIKPRDQATLTYTFSSGKPVAIKRVTHSEIVEAVLTNCARVNLPENCRIFSWITSEDVTGKILSQFLPLFIGGTVTYGEYSRCEEHSVKDVAPHVIVGPPRLWEFLKSGIETELAGLYEGGQLNHEITPFTYPNRMNSRAVGSSKSKYVEIRCPRTKLEMLEHALQSDGLRSDGLYVLTESKMASKKLLEFFTAIGVFKANSIRNDFSN